VKGEVEVKIAHIQSSLAHGRYNLVNLSSWVAYRYLEEVDCKELSVEVSSFVCKVVGCGDRGWALA